MNKSIRYHFSAVTQCVSVKKMNIDEVSTPSEGET